MGHFAGQSTAARDVLINLPALQRGHDAVFFPFACFSGCKVNVHMCRLCKARTGSSGWTQPCKKKSIRTFCSPSPAWWKRIARANDWKRVAPNVGGVKVTSPAFSMQGGSNRHDGPSNLCCWTINVGGLAGLWRMIHLLHQLVFVDRPEVVFFEEACCDEKSWVGIHGKLDAMGFQSWFSGSSRGRKKIRGGVIIAIKSCIPAKHVFIGVAHQGQLIAVELRQLLILGSYCPPDSEALDAHMHWLHGTWQQLQWRGHWIWVGDWNRSADDTIGQLAQLCGDCHIGTTNCSTRWTSDKCIDYFLGALEFFIYCGSTRGNL